MTNAFIDELVKVFKSISDRRVAHAQCVTLLEKMAASEEFLFDIIRQNLSRPSFLQQKRTYPTLAMPIAENSEFTFVMNIFPPLTDRSEDISFQSIHHHGALLLTTVCVLGPGYRSILYSRDFAIDPLSGRTNMKMVKTYQCEKGKAEFVDSYQPHIVFYPKAISATFALWCDEKKQAKEIIKKIPGWKRIRKPAARLLEKLGVSRHLGMNTIAYFDFYVDKGEVVALKDRVSYEMAGDNDNFLRNIFYFIQEAGFTDKLFLESLLRAADTPAAAHPYIRMLIAGEKIEDQFYQGHLDVPMINLRMNEVLNATTHA